LRPSIQMNPREPEGQRLKQERYVAWLEETGDTEAMMRLAAALGGFWFWGSRRREGAAWLERALADADIPAQADLKPSATASGSRAPRPEDLLIEGDGRRVPVRILHELRETSPRDPDPPLLWVIHADPAEVQRLRILHHTPRGQHNRRPWLTNQAASTTIEREGDDDDGTQPHV